MGLPLYEQLPRPPGENEVKVRGNAYRGHLEYVEKLVPGGVAAMLDKFVDPALRAFFEQRFLAASWYDIFPLIAAGHVCAKLTNVGFETFLRLRTRWQAESDLTGIYKIVMKLATEDWVATRLPKMIGEYLDFGAVATKIEGKNHVVIVHQAVPEPVVSWYQPIISTYTTVGIEIAGGKNVVSTARADSTTRIEKGLRCADVRVDIHWE